MGIPTPPLRSGLIQDGCSFLGEYLHSLLGLGLYPHLTTPAMCASPLRFQMRQDPELSPSFELPPRSWREAGQMGVGTESEFLEGMKGGLDRCACGQH